MHPLCDEWHVPLRVQAQVHPPAGSRCRHQGLRLSLAVAARDTEKGQSRWILDMGASMHLCGQTTAGERTEVAHSIILDIASGQIDVRNGVCAGVEDIGRRITCAEMPCEVQALSIGKLCFENGFSMAWRPLEPRPDFIDLAGNSIPVSVQNFVPLLIGGTGEKSGSAVPVYDAGTSGDGGGSEAGKCFMDVSSIGHAPAADSWERVVNDRWPMDDEAVDDELGKPPIKPEVYGDDFDEVALRVNREGDVDSIGHKATHLPMASKSPSRRRPESRMTMVTAESGPSGRASTWTTSS